MANDSLKASLHIAGSGIELHSSHYKTGGTPPVCAFAQYSFS